MLATGNIPDEQVMGLFWTEKHARPTQSRGQRTDREECEDGEPLNFRTATAVVLQGATVSNNGNVGKRCGGWQFLHAVKVGFKLKPPITRASRVFAPY